MWDAFRQVIGACLARLVIWIGLVAVVGLVVVLLLVCGNSQIS